MPPRVSVLLPAYNAAATVARAVSSIRMQSFADWELLVVDDGSVDDTVAAVDAAAAGDARVRVIRRPHTGLVGALNGGLGLARGELVARMDADDVSLPDRLAAQVALLDAEPGLGLAGCLVEFAGARETAAGYALHVDWTNTLVTADAIATNRFVESPFPHPSVLFRRRLVTAFGGYRDGDFPEDYELWLRWLGHGVRMAKVPRVLLRWHDGAARLSRTDPRYSPEAFFRMKAEWIAREVAVAAGGRPVWIWGAGRPTRKRAAHLAAHGVVVAGYIDVDPKKAGRRVAGVPVILPSDLPHPAAAFVLGYVSSRGARDLIRKALAARGHREPRDFLMCA